MNKETSMLWFILYGEEYERSPDPNKPENMVYHKAKQKERAERMRSFMTGAGSVLFEEWKKKIRSNMAAIVSIPEKEMDNCPACMIIRETKTYLKLLLDAEMIISENK
jgi:hypothetical protein